MKWLREFLSESSFSLTDKTDKTSLKKNRMPYDKRFVTKTGLPPTDKTDKTSKPGLDASKERLEAAGIRIAIFVTDIDAGLQVTDREVRNNSEAQQAITEGGAIYTPQDMCHYIQLEPHERRMLHDFKNRFGGTVEWRPAQ
jgi:hypothetical protein